MVTLHTCISWWQCIPLWLQRAESNTLTKRYTDHIPPTLRSLSLLFATEEKNSINYHKLLTTANAQFLTCRATSLKYLWVSQIFKTCIFGSRPLKFAVHNKEPWQCDFSAVGCALQLTFIKLSDWSGLLSCTL